MAKKQGNLKIVFLVFIIIELVLVILSSRFTKKLQVGFEAGIFQIRNVKNYYDLQDKITEDFQRDEFLLKSTKFHLFHIRDFNRFSEYLVTDNPVMQKCFSLLNSQIQDNLSGTDQEWTEENKNELINELNKNVISNSNFYEASFEEYLAKDSLEKKYSPEIEYLLQERNKSPENLSVLDIARLNRVIIEGVIPAPVLDRQEFLPRIFGSFKLYDLFRNIFGEASAFSAFYLIRILLIVDLIFIALIILIRRSLGSKPSKGQLIIEMIYDTFEEFVTDTLGKERAHFTPYIVTIFLFIWVCNMVGLIPLPGFMEPTRNINVPFGMGIIVILVVHFTAIRTKGFFKHLENYVNPIKNPLALLDIVSEFSKVVSISFRLFGNILGGAIIIVVVSSLVNYVVFPVGLNLFFGIFVGTVQAFVFTMLALTYIGVEISE